MKAAEYAAQLQAWIAAPPTLGALFADCPEEKKVEPADFTDCLLVTCGRLLAEAQQTADVRKVQTDAGWLACLREQEEKWYAIVRRVSDPRVHRQVFARYLRAAQRAVIADMEKTR